MTNPATEVYELIEIDVENKNAKRRSIVIDRLNAKKLKKAEEAPLTILGEKKVDKYDELVKDVDVVKKFVPNTSREEILAYLEALHENPDRVRVVIGELRGMVGPAPFPVANGVRTGAINEINESGPIASTSGGVSVTMDSVKSILEVFPDADPEYLRSFIETNTGDVNFVNVTVSGWLESGKYPKLAEAQKAATTRKLIESDFSVEEFLEMFPDAENYFENNDRPMSANYKLHVQIYLQNQFPLAHKADLTRLMIKHNFHLTPIMNQLNAPWNLPPTDGNPWTNKPYSSTGNPSKKRKITVRKKKTMTDLEPMPKEIDLLFYKEKLFVEMKDRIKQFKTDKETERTRKFAMAKQNDELMTCDCCFEDELRLEDMLQCSDGHLFCRTCIRHLAEVRIGQDKYQFPCLDAYCETEFPLTTLREVLAPNVLSNLMRKMQEEEIRHAGIADLESCPHCSFCAIMPDANVKIFCCLNPECFKVTCRLCKEANHVPLSCEEKKAEMQFRSHIEDRMTEALLRTCPRCKRRIVKEEGCNMMTCTCGQTFCYVCREPIANYAHFQNGRCPQLSNDDELHRLEVQEGAKKAKQEYVATHPEVQAMELKNDPSKAPFPAVQRRQQEYARAAMPRLNEQGLIVFQQINGPRPNAQGAVARPNAQGAVPMPNAQGAVARPNAQGAVPRPNAQGLIVFQRVNEQPPVIVNANAIANVV